MENLLLNASNRNIVGKQIKALRREGGLPAVVYGHNVDSFPILLEFRDTSLKLRNISPSTLILLSVDGQDYHVLVRDRQYDVLRGQLIHIDFQAVSMTEKIKSAVTLVFVGESGVTISGNGIVVTEMNEVEVEALPQDLPSSLEVNLELIKEVGDVLYVKDIELPPNVEVQNEPDEIVAMSTYLDVVEDEEEAEELEYEAEPEVIGRGKQEEEKEE